MTHRTTPNHCTWASSSGNPGKRLRSWIKRVKKADEFYITKSVRKGDNVYPKTLEYLGRDPGPARLKRALAYWRVKRKPGKGRRRTA